MPFHDEADPFCDDPPLLDIYRQQQLELAEIGLGIALLAAVLFLGMRCAVHRNEDTLALMAS